MKKIILILIVICIFYLKPIKAESGIMIKDGDATLIDLGKINADVHISSDGLKLYNNSQDADIVQSFEKTINPNGYYFIGETNKYSITVDRGVNTIITLDNVTISSSFVYSCDDLNYGSSNSKDYASCINVSNADVTLILKGTNTLLYKSGIIINGLSSNGAALEKSGLEGTLIIKSVDDTNNHSLICVASSLNDVAIGNAYATVSGKLKEGTYESFLDKGFTNIIIKSGTIKATSGMYAAGIGSSNNADLKNLTILSANIYAKAGDYAAGIGSGSNGMADGIYINNANIEVYGGYNAPGIGSGGSDYPVFGPKDAKNIEITGKDANIYCLGNNNDAIGAGSLDEYWIDKNIEKIKKGNEINIILNKTNADKVDIYVKDNENNKVKIDDDKSISDINNSFINIIFDTPKYTITYDFRCDGIDNNKKQYYKNEQIDWQFDVVRAGYQLEGWYYEPEYINIAGLYATDNITYYAKWVSNTFVTFVYNYGLEDDMFEDYKEEIIVGSTISKPSDPILAGYIFNGWYLDKELTKSYDFKTPLTASNMPNYLYAFWSKDTNKYNVYFVNTNLSAVVVNGGEIIKRPDNPRKSGYKFIGWYKDREFKELYNFEDPINNDTRIYALFEKNKINSNYIISGCLAVSSIALLMLLFKRR